VDGDVVHLDLRQLRRREAAVGNRAGRPAQLQLARLRHPDGQDKELLAAPLFNPTAGLHHELPRELLADGDQPQEAVGRVAEDVGLVQVLGEPLRQLREAHCGKQYPRRTGRVAVGILSAAHGDGDRAVRITVAVEQAKQHISAVDLAVNAAVGSFLVFRVLAGGNCDLVMHKVLK